MAPDEASAPRLGPSTAGARSLLAVGSTAVLVGIGLSASGSPELGSWVSVGSLAVLLYGLHRFGRSGADHHLARVLMILDPSAPVRLRDVALQVDGLGTLLADSFHKGPLTQQIAQVVIQKLPGIWVDLQEDPRPEHIAVRKSIDMMNFFLGKTSPGFGDSSSTVNRISRMPMVCLVPVRNFFSPGRVSPMISQPLTRSLQSPTARCLSKRTWPWASVLPACTRPSESTRVIVFVATGFPVSSSSVSSIQSTIRIAWEIVFSPSASASKRSRGSFTRTGSWT